MISNELIIHSYRQGVTLACPDAPWASSHQCSSVGQIMGLPVNIYFMNCESVMQKMNEASAGTCGFMSEQDAVGRSIRHVSSGETARRIFENDRAIVSSQNPQVISEGFTRFDDLPLTALSIKFPWYRDDEVVGILGCSILQGLEGVPSLTEALTMLIQAGLLAPAVRSTVTATLSGWGFAGNLLDQRDKQILYLLVRGNTAKHIAKQLQLSHRTIEHRLEVIKCKLMVTSKAELIEKIVDQLFNVPAIEGI